MPVQGLEFEKAERLGFEKEMLGLYVSDHPLRGLEASLTRHTDCPLAELRDLAVEPTGGPLAEGVVRSVGGVVTELKRQYTKKGEQMAKFVLEDLEASMEVIVFPRVMADFGALLANDAIVVVRGRLDLRDETPKIVAIEVRRPELIVGAALQELRIALPLEQLSEEKVDRLRMVLLEHPGSTAVLLHVGGKVLRLPPEFNVDSHNGLVGELKTLLGPNAIVAVDQGFRVPGACSGWEGVSASPYICAMAMAASTKDCTALTDTELVEMADLCAEREACFDIGFVSKQREEWVLVTQAREGSKLRGYSFCTLERIGGTPSLLVGVATIDRTTKAETALKAMMADQYRRALLAFPDEDVLLGPRLLSARRVPGLRRAHRRRAAPATTARRARSGPGPVGSRSASATRASSTTAPSSPGDRVARRWPRLRVGQEPARPQLAALFSSVKPARGDAAGRVRLGHGRGPRRRRLVRGPPGYPRGRTAEQTL